MNYKSFIVIALVLAAALIAAPVAAEGMWNGENWVDTHHNDKCTKVIFDPQTGNTNCYNENVGAKADIAADPNSYSGRAEVIIKVHSNALNPVMYLANNLTPNITEPINVNNDGLNSINDLAPGEFILTLDRFDLPDEVAHFTIAAGQQGPTRVVFEGQGYGAASAICQREVLKASYCGVTIPAATHEEYRYWISSHEHQCVPGFGEGCGAWAKEISVDTSHWSEWQRENPHRHGQQSRTVIDTPAVLGGCADVTQNIREALAQGYTKFLFDNSAPHHGIYDITTTTLLSSVDDPAVGIVKDVSISYRTCAGVEQTIETKEYQVITLN